MKKLCAAFVVLAVACTSTGPSLEKATNQSSTAGAPAPGWNASMQELRTTLTELQPYLYDTVRYDFPANKDVIGARIEKLAKISSSVDHDPTVAHRDPSVKFIAGRFAKHLRRASEQYNDGRRMYARYEVMSVTRYCVECHTRMPGGAQFILGTDRSFLEVMPVLDRAEYLVSAREFDAAFDLLLKTLEDPRASSLPRERASKLALQIAVQFRGSPRFAREVVRAVEANPSTPRFLQDRARGWKRSIEEWEKEKPKPDTLASLRTLVEARATDIEPLRALPRVLARLADAPPAKESAELLRLAGQCYEAVDEISSLGLAQNYYEACIRTLPHSATARACYSALEASIYAGYSGSSGLHLPGDVREDLKHLREIAD